MWDLLQSALLAATLSVDAFCAFAAIAASKTRSGALPKSVVTVMCAVVVAIAMLIGEPISALLGGALWVSAAGCVVLFIIGAFKIYGFVIKTRLRPKRGTLLDVYANPEDADADNSKTLSAAEALVLSVTLSADGLAAGVSAALAGLEVLYVFIFSLIIGAAAVWVGDWFGRKASGKAPVDITVIAGFALMAMASAKLIALFCNVDIL